LLSLALSATTYVACDVFSSESEGATESVVPTALTIDPKNFLGDVPCSALPGAMRSYVATLVDLSDATVTPRSSPPTACSQPVSFRDLTVGHAYELRIDGYEEPPCLVELSADAGSGGSKPIAGLADCPEPAFITPTEGPSSETGEMTRIEHQGETLISQTKATPRWTTTCDRARGADGDAGAGGGADAGVGLSPVQDRTVYFGGCDPLNDMGMSPTAIEVDPRATLGLLACAAGGASGTIQRFDVVPQNGALSPVTGLPCDQATDKVTALYNTGLQPGVSYSFQVLAYETQSGPATQKATCNAVAKAGLTTAASCLPLAPISMP